MKYNMFNEMVGEYDGYKVYRNSQGFLEGYKGVGKGKEKSSEYSDVKRVVSNQTTMEGFEKYVRGLKKRVASKDKPITTDKLPHLPFND